jgi:DNA-binding NarL/FixJ family response regulator
VTELGLPTRRKREVLELVADGYATKQIAARLRISDAAVDKHLRQLFRRYGVPNRAALVCAAFRRAHLV